MSYAIGDGRIWLQRKKFEGYDLLLPYGLTNVTDPVGGLTPVREPSATKRRTTVITDILRGEPGLPEFQIETRLKATLNYMFALKDCAVNYQAHLGACDRADNYTASEIMLHWERSHRGDMTIDRLSKIQGDEAPIQIATPWSAEVGPILIDFMAEFLSARTIAESENITGVAFLESECFEDCKAQEDAGENGYIVTAAAAGSPSNKANVWFTEDKGESWAEASAYPFAGGEDISDVVLIGTKYNHRVIVARGTTDAGNPAEIAYADVTDIGTTTWVNVNVGAVNGQYINKLLLLDSRHLYAITNDGYVYLSSNLGASWTAKLTTAVNALYDIAGLGSGEHAGTIWVVGASNTIYLSEDFGSTWTAKTGPTAGAGDAAKSVTVTPDGTMIFGNDAGEIYGTYDEATEWHVLAAQGVIPTSVDALACWGDSLIWIAVNTASGGRVLRSTDGGASFRLWHLNIPTNSGLTDLEAVDPNIVYVVGAAHSGMGFITRTKSNVTGI
jgi:photosystem II stability/assembly factor-like uncharacterized protein